MVGYADASASLLGYQFQLRMALLTAIQTYKQFPSRDISIERFDDIAIEEGERYSIQFKPNTILVLET